MPALHWVLGKSSWPDTFLPCLAMDLTPVPGQDSVALAASLDSSYSFCHTPARVSYTPENTGSPRQSSAVPIGSFRTLLEGHHSGGQPGPREALSQEARVWAELQLGCCVTVWPTATPQTGGRDACRSPWQHCVQMELGPEQVRHRTPALVISPSVTMNHLCLGKHSPKCGPDH